MELLMGEHQNCLDRLGEDGETPAATDLTLIGGGHSFFSLLHMPLVPTHPWLGIASQ